MGDLSGYSIEHYETSPGVRYIMEGVAEGTWPWTPTIVDLYSDYDIDFNQYRIHARAKGPGYDLEFKTRVDRDAILDGDLGWAQKVHDDFLQLFRRRWAPAVTYNIELGEY